MLKAGDTAPDFTLEALEGGSRSLGDLIQGGPVVLAFYKGSCPVSQYTLPFLDRLASSGGLRVWGVSQDDGSSTREFLKRYGLNFPVLLDDQRSWPASNGFRITNVPTMFLVEPDRSISWVSTGFNRRELEDLAARASLTIFRGDERVPDWKPG